MLRLLVLGCCFSAVSGRPNHDNVKDHAQENIDKMKELTARWNRLHPQEIKPLSEETKAFLEKYSATEIVEDEEQDLTIPEINEDTSGLIEGDIIPSDFDIAFLEERLRMEESSETKTKRAASMIHQPNFPIDTPIPFILSDGYDESQKEMIRTALKSIEANTCINFEENGKGLKLEYSDALERCESYIGDMRQHLGEGKQVINLGKQRCMRMKTIQHETIHALGFAHTMSRPDRDEYIEFYFNKMDKGAWSEFKVIKPEQFSNHSIPYEYNSVMHYGSTQTSLDQQTPSMMPIENDYITSIGGDHGPTFNDWKQINIRYDCNGKCPTKISCMYKGYVHPRDCNRCVCPIFFTGNTCERGINITILESEQPKTFNYDTLVEPDVYYPEEWNFTKFNKELHLIQAPEGQKIRITLDKIESDRPKSCLTECTKNAVEIVDGDLSLVGKRFCCNERTTYTFVSKTNVVGYQVYSMAGLNFSSQVTFSVEPPGVETTSVVPSTGVLTTINSPTTLSESETPSTATSQTDESISDTDESSTTTPTTTESASTTGTHSTTVESETTTTEFSSSYETTTRYPEATTTNTPVTDQSKIGEMLNSIKSLLSEVSEKVNDLARSLGF